ncbi:MAG: response regulator transcription factor [Acidimicrobiales bacterium]
MSADPATAAACSSSMTRKHITELLAMALGYQGFEVERAATGREALEAVSRRAPDLIVLDVMLPDLDGFEVARRLRLDEGAGTRVPVIFLTAKDATEDKVQGLRLGSDDYVTKPFSVEELIERVKAVLRRSSGKGPDGAKLSFADLELDEETRDVRRWSTHRADAHRVQAPPLPPRNARRAHPRSDPRGVWTTPSPATPVLETYISYLRQKVDASEPALIHTVRGVGYCLRLPR